MGIVLPEGIFNNPSLARVREFTEDRAFLRAVVSLPPETFISSGASVKCSLLFLQKFTLEEEESFAEVRKAAVSEIEAKYAPEIAAERTRLETEIAAHRSKSDKEKAAAPQKELRDYLSRMASLKILEARLLAKTRFPYSIFMYEAEHVGISATGEEDTNELGPSENLPQGITRTCLEWFQIYKNNPSALTGVN